MSAVPVQSAYNPLSRRWYLTAAPYDKFIYLYDEKAQTLIPVPGATPVYCPKDRILRETGRKLYPGVNPGVPNTMVAVYDEVSFLNGYIDPNAAIFVLYTTDLSYFSARGVNPVTKVPNRGPPVYTLGPVTGAPANGSLILPNLYNTGFGQVLYHNTRPNADVFINPLLGNIFEVSLTSASASMLTGTLTFYLRDPTNPTTDLALTEAQTITILVINYSGNTITLQFSNGSGMGFITPGPITLTTGSYNSLEFTLNGVNGYELVAGGASVPPGTNYGDYLFWNPSVSGYSVGSANISLGGGAGSINQGQNAIAIGKNAGLKNQWPSSIVINATGNELDASTNSGLFVAPIRSGSAPATQLLTYNPSTFEIVQTTNALPYIPASATSTAFGQNWTLNTSAPPALAWYGVSVSSTGQYQLASASSLGATGNLWASSDYGQTWTDISVAGKVPANVAWYGVSVSETGQYQTAIVSGGAIYVSADYGQTWAAKASTNNWRCVSISATGQYQTAGVNIGDIYTSADYGQTWKNSSTTPGSGLPVNLRWNGVSVSSTGNVQTAVVFEGNLYVSYDYGNTWVNRSGTGPGQAPGGSLATWGAVSISDTGQYQTAAIFEQGGSLPGHVWCSADYGETWIDRSVTGIGNLPIGYSAAISISASGQYQAIALVTGASSSGIYVSSDYGYSWANPLDPVGQWTGIAMSASGQYMIASVIQGGLFTCNNNFVTGTATNQIALGYGAGGQSTQGAYAIAVGANAGNLNQGTCAIAIGANAGLSSQWPSSIILNATGHTLNANTNSGLFVAPVRYDSTQTQVLLYNSTTMEVVFANSATSGPSTNRPTSGLSVGFQYFDTTLIKPIWYTGSGWVDATGTAV